MQLVQIQSSPEQFEFGYDVLKTDNKGYYIYVTEACNLRCSYCFVTDKQNNRHMMPDMIEKVIDFIINDTEGRKSKYIHFFGGEPLIKAKTIDLMAKRFRDWAAESKCELRLGITTNGTLLTVENCEMLKSHNIGVQLSVDGSEEGHNVHRQLMGGDQKSGNISGDAKRSAGAFHLIKTENYIKYFGGKEPNCRMTVTTENMQYLLQSLKELSTLHGFKSFSVVPEADSRWSKEDIYKYRAILEQVFEWWAFEGRAQGIVINTIKSVMDKMTKRKIADHTCQAGRTVIGITVDGEIFPCHDYSGKFSKDPEERKSLLLGNVVDGYTSNVSRYQDHRVCSSDGEIRMKSGAGYDCNTCYAKYQCDKGCPYVNRSSTGDDWTVSPNYCEFNRIYVDLGNRLLTWIPDEFTIYTKQQVRQLNEKMDNLAKRALGPNVPGQAKPNGQFRPNGAPRPVPVDPNLVVGRTTGQVTGPTA